MTLKQASFCKNANDLMENHARAIVHLRGQIYRDPKRVGLILGAGVSQGIKSNHSTDKLPSWHDLISAIAQHPDVKNEALLISLGAHKQPDGTLCLKNMRRSLSSAAQMLAQAFKTKATRHGKSEGAKGILATRSANTKWMGVVHQCLYGTFQNEESYESAISQHPYLSSLGKLIRQIPLTINFNFDDALERLLFQLRDPKEKDTSRGYQTIWEPNSLTSKDTAVIYHPNGVLPYIFTDGPSPEIVLSDDAFHDQISNIASGRSPLLTNYLHINTCLLIGLSLDDISLQQTLRQNAVSHPGHIHYVIHFMQSETDCEQEVREAIFNSNFECFGLYTFFVDDGGIRDLIDLISLDQDGFKRTYGAHTLKYVYYIVGSVGVGKTSAIKHLQSLKTYDEWIDRRLPELAKPEDTIDPNKKKEIDRWLPTQFFKKNYQISEAKEFLHLVDRCPLDPLTFGLPEERLEKAKNLHSTITQSNNAVECGHIILLTCGIDELRHRKSRKHKHDWNTAHIQELADRIEEVYGAINKTSIPTDGRSPESVSKEVARTIFLSDYNPVDIGATLEKYSAGTLK